MTNAPALPAPLAEGHARFRAGAGVQLAARYEDLAANGQKPHTLVIACCDSRAAPETIFDAGPGELFIVRNVANLVPAWTTEGGPGSAPAAIEYAVQALGVETILVLGHARCGGIQAALTPLEQPLSEGDFVTRWMQPMRALAEEVNAAVPEADRARMMEHRAIAASVQNLSGYPFIAEKVADGSLRLCGAWFDISKGTVETVV